MKGRYPYFLHYPYSYKGYNAENLMRNMEIVRPYQCYQKRLKFDFVKPSDEAKRTYTFLATGSPIGENIIDPATSLSDVPAYSKTFLQTKVMPVYEEHFKNIFKYHVATLSEPLPYEIDTSIQSFASTRQGGRSKENYVNNPVTFSMRLPSEIELFGHSQHQRK